MSPTKFGIFLIFPYFLRSHVLSPSTSREATRKAILDISFRFTYG